MVGEFLSELDDALVVDLVKEMPLQLMADILAKMPSDDAVDLLEVLPEEMANDIRKHMEKKDREEMEDLLQYHPETAGGLMSPDYMYLDEELSAGEAISLIQKRSEEKEMVFYLYITHGDGKLGRGGFVAGTAHAPASPSIEKYHEFQCDICNDGHSPERCRACRFAV